MKKEKRFGYWFVSQWTLGYYLLCESFWDNLIQIFHPSEWIVLFQKMFVVLSGLSWMLLLPADVSRRCFYRWPLFSHVTKQPLCIAYALWTWRVYLRVPLVSCLSISVLSLLLTIHFCIEHFSGVQLTLESMVPLLSSFPLWAENKNNCLLCPKAQDKILSGFYSHFCG